MPEVRYEALQEVLTEAKESGAAPVYLLYGDEFLYKSAFKRLLDSIVAPRQQDLNYEGLDGDTVGIDEVIARLNTYPLLPAAKVIAVHDTNIFYSRVRLDELLKRSKEAFDRQGIKESAHYFVRMLSIAGLSLEDVSNGDWERCLDLALGKGSRAHKEAVGPWLREVIDYCLLEQVSVKAHEEDAEVLNEAITAGLPAANHLMLTTEFVDKRRKLYKTIHRIGMIIDCSVPQGDRVADRRQQKESLLAHMRQTLTRAGKTMAPGGFEALYERTGGGLRSFSNELEKLITFVGERTEILADDVQTASQKTKQDPIYELTNAIGERQIQKALYLVGSLLRADLFPLQILSAVVNQVRKLILARDFIRGALKDSWRTGMSYGSFQSRLLPELDKLKGDLLTGNVHPFVIYKTFVHSENYTFPELAEALEILLEADIRLKTSGQDAKLILEHAVLAICGPSTNASAGFAV